jgi:hypothetical protein
MATNLTSEQLEFLKARHKPPASAHEPGASASAAIWPRFETLEACRHEDRTRAAALRELHEGALLEDIETNGKRLSKRGRDELVTLLENIADPDRRLPMPPCPASSLYMRDRRIGVLGAVLELIAANPDLDRAWFTGDHPALRFRANGRHSRVAVEAMTRLNEQLRVSGASATPGFLIAFLNGYFDPRREQFHLQYRGLVLGNKLQVLRRALQVNSPPRGKSGLGIRVFPIRDLRRQITKIMPNILCERVDGQRKSESVRRMREPYLSLYLMWLARRRLADIIIIDGAFYWDGGLSLRECYGNDIGQHALSTLSTVGRTAPAPTDERSVSHAKRHSSTPAKAARCSTQPIS